MQDDLAHINKQTMWKTQQASLEMQNWSVQPDFVTTFQCISSYHGSAEGGSIASSSTFKLFISAKKNFFMFCKSCLECLNKRSYWKQ